MSLMAELGEAPPPAPAPDAARRRHVPSLFATTHHAPRALMQAPPQGKYIFKLLILVKALCTTGVP